MEKIKQYENLINKFVIAVQKDYKEKQNNIQLGKYVNVFSLWNEVSGIKEPIHSRILHFFLSPNTMHGQGYKFIYLFLKKIGVPFKEGDEWVSTAEIGHVDVMLKRFFPQSVIIIENKSNWAEDQPNQLYRYWYENIHHSEEDCDSNFYNDHQEYKAVYLVPNRDKKISEESLKRPSDYPSNLPEKLPMSPIIWSFNDEIAKWLDDCISILPKENTPLINLIFQYKEFCKNL